MNAGRRNIASGSPYEKSIGFSRAVRVGNTLWVGGTAPIGANGKTVGAGDPAAQTRRCFEIISEALGEAGAELKHVVRTRIFVTDLANWEAIGRAHGEIFAEIRPASTLVEVSGLIDPDWLVEIEADAVIGDGEDNWDNAWAARGGKGKPER